MKPVILFGLIDLFAVAVLFLALFGIKSHLAITLAIFLLFLKSLPFLLSNFCLASVIDIFYAIVLVFINFVNLPFWIVFIALIALGQKVVFSFA